MERQKMIMFPPIPVTYREPPPQRVEAAAYSDPAEPAGLDAEGLEPVEAAAVEVEDQGELDDGDAEGDEPTVEELCARIDAERAEHAEETRRDLERAAHEAETEEELDLLRAENPELAELLDAAREGAEADAEDADADRDDG